MTSFPPPPPGIRAPACNMGGQEPPASSPGAATFSIYPHLNQPPILYSASVCISVHPGLINIQHVGHIEICTSIRFSQVVEWLHQWVVYNTPGDRQLAGVSAFAGNNVFAPLIVNEHAWSTAIAYFHRELIEERLIVQPVMLVAHLHLGQQKMAFVRANVGIPGKAVGAIINLVFLHSAPLDKGS